MKLLALILVLASFAATVSCLKKQNLEADDGPLVSLAEMQKHLADAWVNDDPHNMQKNEFTSVVSIQTLQDVQSRYTGQEGFTILDKAISSDHSAYNMRMAIQTAEYTVDGQTKLSTEELPFSVSIPDGSADVATQNIVQKDRLTALASSNPADRIFVTRTFYFLFDLCQSRQSVKISCHNLQVTDGVMDAPEEVIRDNLCKPNSGCKLNFRQFDFDLVMSDPADASKKDKYKLQIKISHDVPYLARVISYCQRGMYQLSGSQQKVTVNVCQTVNKYQFGTP